MLRIKHGSKGYSFVESPSEIVFSQWLAYHQQIVPNTPEVLGRINKELLLIADGTKKAGNEDVMKAYKDAGTAENRLKLAEFYLSELDFFNPQNKAITRKLKFSDLELIRNRFIGAVSSYAGDNDSVIADLGWVLPKAVPMPFYDAPFEQYTNGLRILDAYEKMTGGDDKLLGTGLVIKDVSAMLPLAAEIWTDTNEGHSSSPEILQDKAGDLMYQPLSKILDAVFFFIKQLSMFKILTQISTEEVA